MFCEKMPSFFVYIYSIYVSGKIALTATPFYLDGFSDCSGIQDRQSQKFSTLYVKWCGCGSWFYKIIDSG